MRFKLLMIVILSTFAVGACAAETGTEPEPAPAPPAQEPAAGPAGTREDPYIGHGVIQEVREGQLVIQHDAIPGLMMAMTMGFPVSEEVDLAGLAAGDEIMFNLETLEPGSHRIFSVERAEGGAVPQ